MSARNKIDVRAILSAAPVYSLFRRLVAPSPWQDEFVHQILEVEDGERILDIGCGPADILKHLPDVDYVGFDTSKNYIAKARSRFKSRGRFFQQTLTAGVVDDMAPFDLVMAIGVVHHLSNEDAILLFETAKKAMLAGARLITLDGAYTTPQNRFAKLLLDMDRGDFIRTPEQYRKIAASVFPNVAMQIKTDMLRLPYTHCIMECRL